MPRLLADVGPLKRLTSRAFFELMRRLSETEMRIAASDYRLLSRRAELVMWSATQLPSLGAPSPGQRS